MNMTTNRSRTAHGLSVAVAWTALAAALTLVPTGAANAMPRLGRGVVHASAYVTPQHIKPKPRLWASPQPRLRLSPEPRVRLSPEPRLRLSPEPRLRLSPEPRMAGTVSPTLRMR